MLRDGCDALAASWYAECREDPPQTLELCPTIEDYAPAYAKAWCYVAETAAAFGAENPDY